MMTNQLALTAEAISRGLLTVVPDLCAEVVSPSDRWSAVLERVAEFFVNL